jgi:cytochrome c-type biogenesis protein CcmH/NrfG
VSLDPKERERLRDLYRGLAREELARQGRTHLEQDAAMRAGRAKRTARLIAGAVVVAGAVAALAIWGWSAWQAVKVGEGLRDGRDAEIRRALGAEPERR